MSERLKFLVALTLVALSGSALVSIRVWAAPKEPVKTAAKEGEIIGGLVIDKTNDARSWNHWSCQSRGRQ